MPSLLIPTTSLVRRGPILQDSGIECSQSALLHPPATCRLCSGVVVVPIQSSYLAQYQIHVFNYFRDAALFFLDLEIKCTLSVLDRLSYSDPTAPCFSPCQAVTGAGRLAIRGRSKHR